MDLKNFYEKKAVDYGISRVREKKILELLPRKIKGLKILDVGCATGYLGKKLKKRGAKVYGIDVSKTAIKIAREVIDGAKLADLNTQKIPYAKSDFDIVIASEVIEHLMNPQSVIKEMRRVLKRKGILIITTPNILYWGHRLRFLKGSFRYEESGPFDKSHVHFYTHQTLREDLSQSGFNIIEQNHVFAGTEFLDFIRQKFPSLFAYQFVFLCQKSQ